MKIPKGPFSSVKSLLEAWGIISDKQLKYTSYEMIDLLHKKLVSQEKALEKARKIYLEQVAEIEKLKSPELWTFGVKREAPPDYKAEYFRRMAAKEKEFAPKVRAVKQD